MTEKAAFSDTNLINQVWKKAQIVPNYDATIWRKDIAGAWIKRDHYGRRDSELGFGWEIDHLKPLAQGGTDNLGNLRPLQWKNNCSKGNDYPSWQSVVSSDDKYNTPKNVHRNNCWKIH